MVMIWKENCEEEVSNLYRLDTDLDERVMIKNSLIQCDGLRRHQV